MKTIAVIVTYNPDELDLVKQHNALKEQVFGFVYVDNNSSIRIPFLENENVKIIQNSSNFGLAAAQNQGIEQAIKMEADYVLLLDQDSLPSENMVDVLVQESEKLQQQGKNLGAIGPMIKSMYDNSCADVVTSLGLRIKKEKINGLKESSYIIASGTLVSTNVLKKVGMMDESMFIDNLDIEWCLRAKSFGYLIYVCEKACLNHKLGNGLSDKILSHSPAREYYIIKNSIILAKRNYVPFGFRIRKIVFSVLRVAYSLVKLKKEYFIQGMRGLTFLFKDA